MYTPEAIRDALRGKTGVITLDPKEFENFSEPLVRGQMTYPHIQRLMRLESGFDEVPFLHLYKQPIGSSERLPIISAHEGRHRSKALAAKGHEKSLVQIIPETDILGDASNDRYAKTIKDLVDESRSPGGFRKALRDELDLTGNMIRPEGIYERSNDRFIVRPPIELPEVYADGGYVTPKNPFGKQAAKQKAMREEQGLTPAGALLRGMGETKFGDPTNAMGERDYSVMDPASNAKPGREAEMQSYRDLGGALGIGSDLLPFLTMFRGAGKTAQSSKEMLEGLKKRGIDIDRTFYRAKKEHDPSAPPAGTTLSRQPGDRKITKANTRGGVWLTESPEVADSYMGKTGYSIPVHSQKPDLVLDAKGMLWSDYFDDVGPAAKFSNAEWEAAKANPKIKSIEIQNVYDPGGKHGGFPVDMPEEEMRKALTSNNLFLKKPFEGNVVGKYTGEAFEYKRGGYVTRAEGSPEEGEGYMPPTNPFAGKAAKQAEMRAARGERSRVAAAREKVARTPALDEAGGETTDEFIQRTMGFDSSVNEKRGTFLPIPIKRNGKTEFIAPNIVKDVLLPYNLSSQALTTGRFDESKVPEAAMNTSLASLATGKAPAGSLGMAVKIPGGQWRQAISVTDPVSGETVRGKPSNMSEYIARAMERVPENREDVRDFIVNKLYPYLKKSLGTDSDPIRAAVLEGKVKDDSPLYYGMAPAFREYMLEPAREAQGLQAKIAATEPRIAELRQATQEARDRGLTAEADSAAAQLKALQRTLPYTDAEKRAFATKSEALQDFHKNYDAKTGIAAKIISDPGDGKRADYGLSGAAIETIRNRLTQAGVRPEHQNVPSYIESYTLNEFAKKLFPDNEDYQQALIQGVRTGDPRYKQISDAITFNEPLYDLANNSGFEIPGFKQQEIGPLLSEIPADKLKKMSAAEAFLTAFPTYQLTKDFGNLLEKVRSGSSYPKEALDLFLNRGLQQVKVPDTPGWYRVTTPEAVRLEGAQMRHSVGGYGTSDTYNKGGKPAFTAGTTRVYSLRPQKNKPEVTLDVYDDPDTGLVKVNTVYGKENSDPSPYKEELFKLFDSIPNLDPMSLPRLYYVRRDDSPASTVDWAREYLEARPNVEVPAPRSVSRPQREVPGGNLWENVGRQEELGRQVVDMLYNVPGNAEQMAARQRIRDRIAARNARLAAEGIPPVEE
jgi:hypothetical protein